ncbi:MAG: hypothetical protein Q4D14_07975 [Bacteroidales bacterium]|nr:hypothetical protein [Bacteroidales bacterium]
MANDNSIIVFRTYTTYSEAVVCCNVLKACGIDAFLSNESTPMLGSLFGEVNGVRLHIHQCDVKLATQILDEHDAGISYN